MTREQWLQNIIEQINTELFEPNDTVLPQIQVSVGKPSGNSNAWTISPKENDENPIYHIFISATVLEKSTLVELLFGEVLYATVGRPSKAFKRVFSLTRAGKRWYPEVGSDTMLTLNDIAAAAPPYPHVPVVLEEKEKQSTRMLKITCFNHEDPIILRGASKAFVDGLPVCFCGSEFVKE